jgi:hypothetical protein
MTAPDGIVRLVSGSVQPAAAATSSWHSGGALALRAYSGAGAPFLGADLHLGYGLFRAELSLGRSHVTVHTGDITHSFAVVGTSFELARWFRSPELVPRLRIEAGLAWAQSRSLDVATEASTRAASLFAGALELALRQSFFSRTSGELRGFGGYSGGLTASENGIARSSTTGWMAGVALGLVFDW